MKIGIIGCGNISSTYLRLAPMFKELDFSVCADLDFSVAQAMANEFGCQALPISELLESDAIELIVNLTIPSAHAEVSRQILQAGKHVYSEKPFVLSYAEGVELHNLARQQNLRIGSAPDTFLGGAHQRARQLVDSGEIGQILGGSCFFMNAGMEDWHPNPDFFYQPGAGPMLDMGPYYISNLVQLVGPVKRVMAMTAKPFATRTISSEPRAGEVIPVATPTTVHALLEFVSGAQIMMGMSWDVRQHEHNLMELYGSKATLHIPDPNFFGGELRVATREAQQVQAANHPFAIANDEQDNGEILANYRGAGLADMVLAISEGREHRCNDKLALHVIEIMTSALASGESGQAITLQSSCDRPAALDSAAATALLA